MIFTELRFLGFFALVFLVHWVLRRNRERKAWLLVCSYAFYSFWDWRFAGLILVSTLVDYLVAPRLHAAGGLRARRLWLLASLATNLGLLGVFKYLGFFVESTVDLLEWFGFAPHRPSLSIVLPVGISFYTFQTLSYSLDVYFRRLEPTRKLLDFSLYVAFFPQLVAGPIVRARYFLPFLAEKRRFADVHVRACLILFAVGFFKKACVSDNVAPLADAYFAAPLEFSALGAWSAIATYAVQLYCDFSGYSDMAIACAGLLGYRLPLNFDFPYLASNLQEFWRRWHISLTTWLRDYLYFPLGGDRGGAGRTARNLMLVMLLGGLWHGAGWGFVICGALHGAGLCAYRAFAHLRGAEREATVASRVAGTLLTMGFVGLSWSFFRSESLAGALASCRAYLLLEDHGARDFGLGVLALYAGLLLVHLVASTRVLGRRLEGLPGWAFAALYGVAWALMLPLVGDAARPFIYFQF